MIHSCFHNGSGLPCTYLGPCPRQPNATHALPQGNLWKRKGWAEMDKMRAKLEDLKELRDLVRSLGRGGGWGPLRRAPIQYLDLKARLVMFYSRPSFPADRFGRTYY